MEANTRSNSEPLSATFSQSDATMSFLSAITQSMPSPHVTTSSPAGSLSTKNKSLPPPPERVSFTGRSYSPPTNRSLPSPPTTLSEPLPPQTTSIPSPPTTFLLPPSDRGPCDSV